MTGFRRAAAVQARVIGALMLRELVVQGNQGSAPFLGLVMRPLVIVGTFYLIGRHAGLVPEGIPPLGFVITGYFTWLAFLRCFSGVRTGSVGNLLMFPHVTPLDVVIATIGTEFVLYTAMFVGVSCFAILFGDTGMPADPLGVALGFLSAIGLGAVLGMIAYSIGRFTSILNDFFVGIRLLGHALSGVFTLATSLPEPILRYLRWNPLFHCIEWVRQSWWPQYQSPIADPGYIFLWLFFLTAIGLAFERSSRRWEMA